MIKVQKEQIIHMVKYGISGGISAVSLLSLLYLFHQKLGYRVITSSVCAYTISLCIGFLMQKFWTWSEVLHTGTTKQFVIYTSIGVCNIGLNALGMYIVAVRFSVWYVVSQIIVAGIIAVWSYFLYKQFVFTEPVK